MRRNIDLMREVLLEIETCPPGYALIKPGTANHSHALLLMDAGLVVQPKGADAFFRVTSLGHDFAEVIRDEAAWGDLRAAHGEIFGAILSAALPLLAAPWIGDALVSEIKTRRAGQAPARDHHMTEGQAAAAPAAMPQEARLLLEEGPSISLAEVFAAFRAWSNDPRRR